MRETVRELRFKMSHVCGLQFVFILTMSLYYAFMPLYLKDLSCSAKDWSQFNISLILSLVLFGILSGIMGDKFGRRLMVFFGLGLMGIMLFLLPALRNGLLLFFILFGAGNGVYLTNILVLVQEISVSNTGRVNSLFWGIGSAGGIIGFIIGGYLIKGLSYNFCWKSAGILLFLGGLSILFFRERYRPDKLSPWQNIYSAYRDFWVNREFRYLLVGGAFLQAFGFWVVSLYFSLYMQSRGLNLIQIGKIFGAGQLLYFFSAISLSLFSDRFSKRILFSLGLIIVGIGVIMIGIFNNIVMILISFLLVRETGRVYIHAMQTILITQIVEDRMRAKAISFFTMIMWIGAFAVTLITRVSLSFIPSLSHTFILGGIGSICGGLVIYFFLIKPQKCVKTAISHDEK